MARQSGASEPGAGKPAPRPNLELAHRIATDDEYFPGPDEFTDLDELERVGLIVVAGLYHPVAVTCRTIEGWSTTAGREFKLREESMTIEVGKNMTWHRVSDDRRRTDEIPVKILKIARNGVFVEVTLPDGVAPPDGIKRKARVARDCILPVKPPSQPFVRPPTPPPDPKPMLGQPAGWIPPVMPKPFDPMIVVGDAERTVHAVPTGSRALCGYESATGWQWARGQDVTCEQCWQKHLEAEFERNGIVQHLRKRGYTGPIDRETYISFNWAGCKIRPWTAEHEDALPALLQDWDRFYKNAERREKRRKDQLKRDPEFKRLQVALGLPEE